MLLMPSIQDDHRAFFLDFMSNGWIQIYQIYFSDLQNLPRLRIQRG